MKFFDFIGNDKIKDQLTFLQESDRLPHAIIIEGDEGIGKRTLAREIALNLFCRGEGEHPCRQCPQCVKVLSGCHPDIFEYSAAGGARSFHVDKVREVKEDVIVRPNEADYKIYILGNCQCMNESAQNAILKILEEPPSYALFILTTTTKSALLETVLSRSVVITLEGVAVSLGADYICSKHEDIDYNDALNACTVWGGNIGKALESLNDGRLSKINSIANDICSSLLSENEYSLLTACSVFEKDRDTLVSALGFMRIIFRDAMLYSEKSDVLSGQRDIVRLLSSRLTRQKLMNLIGACDNVRMLAQKNGNNAILITKICYDLRIAIGR